MIKAAIKGIKDRKGCSGMAIAKYLSANYTLPDGYKKRMSLQLKKLVAAEKLIKDKVRYKLGEALKKDVKPKKKPAAKKKPVKKKTPAKKPAVKKPAAKKPAAKKPAPKKKAAPKKPTTAKKAKK